MRYLLSIVFIFVFIEGCTFKYDYIPPKNDATYNNTIIIEKPKEEVWSNILLSLKVLRLNLDQINKSTGVITASYKGDPEEYVDCGQVHTQVTDYVGGEQNYRFPGSKRDQQYKARASGILINVHRTMDLACSINISIESINNNQTKLKVMNQYHLTRNVAYVVDEGSLTSTMGEKNHSISFKSGERAQFPILRSDEGTICQPSGKLEKLIMDMSKGI